MTCYALFDPRPRIHRLAQLLSAEAAPAPTFLGFRVYFVGGGAHPPPPRLPAHKREKVVCPPPPPLPPPSSPHPTPPPPHPSRPTCSFARARNNTKLLSESGAPCCGDRQCALCCFGCGGQMLVYHGSPYTGICHERGKGLLRFTNFATATFNIWRRPSQWESSTRTRTMQSRSSVIQHLKNQISKPYNPSIFLSGHKEITCRVY